MAGSQMMDTETEWALEQQEWVDALADVVAERGAEGARALINRLHQEVSRAGVVLTDAALNTPYKNTIPLAEQPAYPGDIELEMKIENILRWNAAAMVLKAYDSGAGVGGHIATYLSASTMMEVGLHHIFRAPSKDYGGDQVHFQAHTSPEIKYLTAHRAALGGSIPERRVVAQRLPPPPLEFFDDMLEGSRGRPVSTTMVMVRLLQKLLRDPDLGKFIVPIVPDEARTFGMDGLFPQAGIYAPEGQHYQPVDAGTIAPYREAEDGQILQEGICETGAMASFLAAGTAYANYALPMIPFYIFYSMFGFQRVGDMIWACGDMMCKGFLLGGTSGRTTLNGEGVQHQDGHSHVIAATIPNLVSYDPAFAFELAVIVRDGIRRMYGDQEDVFYYLTLTNQNYPMPVMPEGATDGILAGMYAFEREDQADVNLLGSGAIMVEVLAAAETLRALGRRVNVFSVTSYTELARQGIAAERAQMKTAGGSEERPYVAELMAGEEGVFVAASDYMKSWPLSIERWLPGPLTALGTDGYGLSESREDLRDHFEVSKEWIVYAALSTEAQANRAAADEAFRFATEAGLSIG